MATTKLWTIEELEREGMPEGRWELIDGELVPMGASGGDASPVGAIILAHLVFHVVPRRLGQVYGADGGFVVLPGREMLRVPDVAFVRADRIAPGQREGGFLRLAPDLVVEVISPTDRLPDVLDKVNMWLDAGARLLWLVDPRARTVTVHGPDRVADVLTEADILGGSDVLPDFRLSVGEIFFSS